MELVICYALNKEILNIIELNRKTHAILYNCITEVRMYSTSISYTILSQFLDHSLPEDKPIMINK